MGDLVLDALVLGVVAAAAVTDLRAQRIPNWLTLPAALVGLALRAAFLGGDGLLAGLGGWAVGCALLLPLFLLGWLGAGDVKLLAAIGAIGGPELVLFTCLWAGVFGGPIAMIGLIRSRRLGLVLAQAYVLKTLPGPKTSFITVGRIPYAPAIALGAFVSVAGARWIGG